MTAALTLDALSKRFRSVSAVDGISLIVEPGEFVALLGPSGSGKTTMLRLLAGFELPSSGRIVIDGREVSGLAPSEHKIGMVFQHYALFPHMSVSRNIDYGLRMQHWSAVRRKERVAELLRMIRLEQIGDRLPHQLSGGQQQRVAIARALAYSPSILLMDEPLGALDRTLRIEMAEEIRRIHRGLGTTFIYVTHDRDEAMTLADRILVMQNGKIDADGTPEVLFRQPPTAFVAKFFAGMNVLPASALYAGEGDVAFSPSAIALSPPPEPHVQLAARLDDQLFLGDKRSLRLSLVGPGLPLVADVSLSSTVPAIGTVTDVFIRRVDLVTFAHR